MSADNPQIGDIIRSARVSLGLSQSELGQKCGVSKHTVGAWEIDRSLPSFDVLRKLCRALEISSDRLVNPVLTTYTLREEQSISVFKALDEYEQEVALKYMLDLIRLRALRHKESEKQG